MILTQVKLTKIQNGTPKKIESEKFESMREAELWIRDKGFHYGLHYRDNKICYGWFSDFETNDDYTKVETTTIERF